MVANPIRGQHLCAACGADPGRVETAPMTEKLQAHFVAAAVGAFPAVCTPASNQAGLSSTGFE